MRRALGYLLWPPLIAACAAGLQPSTTRVVTDPAATHEIPSFTVPPARAGIAYERFIVIGDMGTGGPGQKRVAAAMTRRARAKPIDFILTVGDNFMPNGVASAEDPQWQTKFDDVYADSTLQVPVYATLGNHDHYGNVRAQMDHAESDRRWNMPASYYTFIRTLDDGTKVQFFAVDTNPIFDEEPEAKTQLAWLNEELGRSDARWKIVFGHHVLYGHHSRWGNNEIMIAALEPILVKHRIDVCFAGHEHVLSMRKPVKGVHYVSSGAGAAEDNGHLAEWTDDLYYVATLGGFVLCRISKDELVIEFVRLNGETQYAHALRK